MSWSNCGNDSGSVRGGECGAQNRQNGNRAGGVIRGVYRFRMNSVCVCGGERGLGASKCAAWNCRDRNGVGGGSRVLAVAVHLGTSPETLTGAEGASANMATSVVSVV